jgi:hypothetical protein
MVGHVASMAEKNSCKENLVKEAGRKFLIRIPMGNLKYEIQKNLKTFVCENVRLGGGSYGS